MEDCTAGWRGVSSAATWGWTVLRCGQHSTAVLAISPVIVMRNEMTSLTISSWENCLHLYTTHTLPRCVCCPVISGWGQHEALKLSLRALVGMRGTQQHVVLHELWHGLLLQLHNADTEKGSSACSVLAFHKPWEEQQFSSRRNWMYFLTKDWTDW